MGCSDTGLAEVILAIFAVARVGSILGLNLSKAGQMASGRRNPLLCKQIRKCLGGNSKQNFLAM